jgi:exopolysaccharide/PEP-CTERM locus tyrosine autokinase
MSRIEQALEKALRMRESMTASSSAPSRADESADRRELPDFAGRPSVIDPAKLDHHIVCIADPLSAAAEQYRKLKARILASTRQNNTNTLMVASSDVAEGKSITAINLAISLAQGIDHTVLLVDADLRKPSIARYLGIEAERGLSEYLAGKVELPDVLIHTGIGRLVILPAGSQSDNPAELLSSNRMKELVMEMKHRYSDRYIIFDSSPILVSADAISLSANVDSILLVIQAAKTPVKVVEKAVSLIKNTPILGVVYNNVPDYMGKNLYPYIYHSYHQDAVGLKK